MTADLTPTEVAALRADAEVMLGGVGRFDPATVLALIHAGYDDTGQPWRDRAERADDLVAEFRKREESQDRVRALLTRERDEARATIDQLEARLESAHELGRAMTACCSKNAATIDRARTLAADYDRVSGPVAPDRVARNIRRVLDGDQEDE